MFLHLSIYILRLSAATSMLSARLQFQSTFLGTHIGLRGLLFIWYEVPYSAESNGKILNVKLAFHKHIQGLKYPIVCIYVH